MSIVLFQTTVREFAFVGLFISLVLLQTTGTKETRSFSPKELSTKEMSGCPVHRTVACRTTSRRGPLRLARLDLHRRGVAGAETEAESF